MSGVTSKVVCVSCHVSGACVMRHVLGVFNKLVELVAGWSVINGGLPGLLGYTAWKEEDENEICSADISAWRKKAASGS